MNRARIVLFGSVVAGALIAGGIIGATASGFSLIPVTAAIAAVSPSPAPAFRSNENPSHEAGESASQEAAENNGTFHPGGDGAGPGGHPCGGHSNENATHEKSETAAHEAAENAPCPASTTSPSPTR